MQQKQPPEVFYKKGVLKNFAKFTKKRLCQSLLFNKVVGPRPVTVLKRRLWRRCFPVNFAIFRHFLRRFGCQMLAFPTNCNKNINKFNKNNQFFDVIDESKKCKNLFPCSLSSLFSSYLYIHALLKRMVSSLSSIFVIILFIRHYFS